MCGEFISEVARPAMNKIIYSECVYYVKRRQGISSEIAFLRDTGSPRDTYQSLPHIFETPCFRGETLSLPI